MDMSEGRLAIRVAREIKRLLRENREIRFETEYIAKQIVKDPQIYQEACLWGNGYFRRIDDQTVESEPDMELVESWVQSTVRKFRKRAKGFEKWIRRNCYVTKWRMDDSGYYLPYQPV